MALVILLPVLAVLQGLSSQATTGSIPFNNAPHDLIIRDTGDNEPGGLDNGKNYYSLPDSNEQQEEEKDTVEETEGCTISESSAPRNMPLISDGDGKLLYPLNDGDGDIVLHFGSRVNFSCAPVTNQLENNVTQGRIEVKCGESGLLLGTSRGNNFLYDELGCRDPNKADILERSTCFQGFLNISIEFTSQERSFPLITVCHDAANCNTIMAKHTVRGGSTAVAQVSNARPSFKKAQFYGDVSPQTAYEQKSQKTIVQTLVGSVELANKYIDTAKSFYFARGHLAPDGDFIYVSEQNATYYFVNVIPQWQSINNGNWKAMEMAVRNLAQEKQTSLDIYTGGFSTLRLEDVNGNPSEIYLAKNPSTGEFVLPVPSLIWKIVHDQEQKSAVVIVMVNNPHMTEVTPEDVVCDSICDQVKWVTWNRTNIQKGYTYCCTLTTFKSKVLYAPELGSVTLLAE